MSTFPQRKLEYDSSLVNELMQLIQQYDNKTYNYLISTMLTGVLMHHLSWVQTVAPPEADTVSFYYRSFAHLLNFFFFYIAYRVSPRKLRSIMGPAKVDAS
jgi:hypothetical protein